MIHLALEIIAFQLVFLLVYDIFLKRETFFQWNRGYLIGTFLCSFFLPAIRIDVLRALMPAGNSWQAPLISQLNEIILTAEPGEAHGPVLPWTAILFVAGLAFSLLLLGRKLHAIHALMKSGKRCRFPEYTRIEIADSSAAFSFFRNIFIGDRIRRRFQKQIIAHELVHVRQCHSLDLLFFELMRLIQWFNPLVYLFQERIAELHEFIADEKIPRHDRKDQFEMLLSSAFDTRHISFINQFFKSSLIKKRIVMLQKSRSRKIWKFKYMLLLPAITLMLCYSSCQDDSQGPIEKTMQVQDVEHMSPAEEQELFSVLKTMSETHAKWNLTVTDGGLTLRFYEASDDSYITGPNDERIHAHMVLEGGASENLGSSLFGSPERIPFGLVENVPVFPGCENAADPRACFIEHMQEHIRNNFNYPQAAMDQGIQGRVNILFTIDRSGKVTDIKKRGPHKLLEEEAVRIMELLPQMTPGTQSGNTVEVPFSIPISFRLTR